MKKTIAITGATGFTGGVIAKHFQQLGWRVIAFGRRTNPNLSDGVHYHQWDIGSGLYHLDEPPDVVVHSAAMVGEAGKYDEFYRANVIGTEHVLNSFPNAGQFIHISSSSVYDPFAEKVMINEDFPYGNHYFNHYAHTKMLTEKTVLAHERSNKIILRPRAIYGERDTTLLPRLLGLHQMGYMLGIGDGDNDISITYIGNFCHAIEQVTKQHFDSEIFNITDNETITQSELLARLAEMMGWYFRPLFLPKSLMQSVARVGQFLGKNLNFQPRLTPYAVHQLAETFTLDISKSRQLLDYNPPFDQAISFARTQAWMIKEVKGKSDE